ncbi:MFS transporter [Chelatococcus sambhunathii]|uniref:MFS transporter n=1 Tax=Chelatococcus sambhunathii TaxID=363953 RepID=A0ABU1DCM3_9HYPH|nr:MFS transporter [Chelatococcus sambhunathii]MDR4305822.1 MFS transporter [Chelatococcus sambhunathii]
MSDAAALRASSVADEQGAGPLVVFVAAVACGIIVANLYYAQPLVDLIARDLSISPSAASAVVALTQIGYAVGLILVAPLVDLFESRRLLTLTLGAAVAALVLAATAPSGAVFLAAALLIGVASVAAQMLLPLVAGMEPEATRGRVVGTIMSGLLFGILLARPVAGVVADWFGWRAVFGLSAALTIATGLALRSLIPSRRPKGGMAYGAFLASMLDLLREHPTLRRRALYQASLFAAFSMFWTASPMRLSEAYGLSHSWIGLFALAGAGGALIAPVAGRWADSGLTRPGTVAAIASVALGFAVAGADGLAEVAWVGVGALLFGAIVLDMGVQANMIFGQRTIYALNPAARGRINGLYVAILFLGGAFGSAITSPLMTHLGWAATAAVGAVLPLVALAFAALDRGDG